LAAKAKRRRSIVLAAGLGLAAAAFTMGAALGDGDQQAATSAAERLKPSQLAGERIVVGFDGATAPEPVRRMIRSGNAAGIILFADNMPSRAAARRLVRGLEGIPRPPGLRSPLLVMTDQEGGLVKRLGGAPTASAQEMGARGAAFSRRQGRRTAENLRDVGVNVDLAPVLDVARPGGTIAETGRAFGTTPAGVAATGVPFAVEMERAGVAATAKHYPGMGAARLNTDLAVERIGLSRRELRERDEPPFQAFVDAGGDLVMLATAIYPAFSRKPAAFSKEIATGQLRARLGFDGVSITDALDSVAVREFGGAPRAALAGVRAGVDLLLFTQPGAAARAHSALLGALRSGRLRRPDLEPGANRVLRLRRGLAASGSG
jgi:beta-N-acetylhexosaminidase